MRRLCESNEGEFSIRWGNKYLICRPRLETYLNQLMVREQNQNDVELEEDHGVSQNHDFFIGIVSTGTKERGRAESDTTYDKGCIVNWFKRL